MQLIHIESASASDDRKLVLMLERRTKAAERCVEANRQAQDAKADLVHHLAARLRNGGDAAVLRNMLLAGGVPETSSWLLLREAREGQHGEP